MRLTVVGCSGSAPSAWSGCSCYLVEHDGYRLLLDAGSGSAGPLQRYATPAELDAVIVSHAHSDHWVDLTQLAYFRGRAGAPPLPVVGPSTLPDVVWSEPDTFAAERATAGDRTLGPLPVRLARVEHGECWATRIGDALCYTADSAPCAALDTLAAGCRVLVAEASGFDADGPLPGHLTAGDAGRLAARSGASLLVVTHLRSWLDHGALVAEAAAAAGCPVVAAAPGLRVAL